MKLDRDPILWVIQNLTNYDHEYDRGPRAQTMTFRKGGKDHDFDYFFADDIRKWLAGELHRVRAYFLPEEVERDFSRGPWPASDALKYFGAQLRRSQKWGKDPFGSAIILAEALTHRVVECSCGWKKSFEINHKDKTWIEDDAALSEAAGQHVRAEVDKIMECYQWD